MKTLELKEIAGYLAHGLKIQRTKDAKVLDCGVGGLEVVSKTKIETARRWTGRFINGTASYMPILRPMSDLASEITHKGEKFVPIVELAKTAYEGGEWERAGFFDDIHQCDCNGVYFGYEPDDGSFIVGLPDGEPVFAPKQRTLFDKFNEWMFDYRDLIGQGLAIDVNTLKENCYE